MVTNINKAANMIYKKPNIRKIICIIYCTICLLGLTKSNPIYAMEHAAEASKAIAENNIVSAERLLTLIREANLTDEQMNHINEMINASIYQQNPDAEYAVHNLDLQNAGSMPTSENQFNWNRILIVLGFATLSLITLYLIIKYWDDIKMSFFHIGSKITKQILFKKIQLVNNPQTLSEIYDYVIDTHPTVEEF